MLEQKLQLSKRDDRQERKQPFACIREVAFVSTFQPPHASIVLFTVKEFMYSENNNIKC